MVPDWRRYPLGATFDDDPALNRNMEGVSKFNDNHNAGSRMTVADVKC